MLIIAAYAYIKTTLIFISDTDMFYRCVKWRLVHKSVLPTVLRTVFLNNWPPIIVETTHAIRHHHTSVRRKYFKQLDGVVDNKSDSFLQNQQGFNDYMTTYKDKVKVSS